MKFYFIRQDFLYSHRTLIAFYCEGGRQYTNLYEVIVHETETVIMIIRMFKVVQASTDQ